MTKVEMYKERIKMLTNDIIDDIRYEMNKAGVVTVKLINGIIHNYIDDRNSEVIEVINVDSNSVEVAGYSVDLVDLSDDKLLDILYEIENGSYYVIEELELDPREVLEKKLIKVGISPRLSGIIALDAGSSQCVVDKEYLRDMYIEPNLQKKALAEVNKFYNGSLE
jgi:hypothetical protein